MWQNILPTWGSQTWPLFFVGSKGLVLTGGWPSNMWPFHPGRLTWTIIMEVWKIIFLSKWVICRFHVNLPGCLLHQTIFHSKKQSGLASSELGRLERSMVEMEIGSPPRPMNGSERASLGVGEGGKGRKSGDHQLRLVVYPMIYRVLAPSQVVQDLVTRDLMFHFPTKRGAIWNLRIFINHKDRQGRFLDIQFFFPKE